MLFNSYIFIFLFLPITFFIYFYLNSKRLTEGSKGFLVFSSLFFYSWWNIVYLPIILGSMLINYVIGTSLTSKEHIRVSKKALLHFGIIINVSLLAYFKYTDFFIDNINYITNLNMPTLNLALPLAISFFTFQQIAYLVDSYKGETKEYDFLNYALFVTFFPQLIAGPIVHHKEMMSQFTKSRNKVKSYKNIALGLFIFTMGLFKKVVIADTFAIWATAGFDMSTTLNLFEAWATSLSYTFQLYFDFSGYTDMAIGAALLFNIKLPINFNSPYKATSIQDFWRRWHITLSRFLRDYVYIPLGGNRKGSFRTYSNLISTFLIGGIWHGAGWTFVFWGFLHGIALVTQRIWQQFGFTVNNVLAWFITFNFINISWVFFRAKEWDDAIKVLVGMFGMNGVVFSEKLFYKINYFKPIIVENPDVFGKLIFDSITFLSILLGVLVILLAKNVVQYSKIIKFDTKLLIFMFILSLGTLLNMAKVSEFLYFNF